MMFHTRRQKRASILLVEDEALICELTAEVLAEQGFDVEAVGSAEEALVCLASGREIDLLFTDVNLPGIDGEVLAQRACAMRPGLPVLYTSGRKRGSDQARPGDRAMFIPKPYNPFDIASQVDRLIARGREPNPALA